MLFRQFLNEDLSCASYVIGNGDEALVVDPAWRIEPYLELAAARGLRIVAVLETHTHADHLSGRGRLAAATGATVYLPARASATDPHATLRDGDVLTLGDVGVETLATPGHRPEHVSYLVREHGRSGEPRLLLSGDSLLVGDVARPDLAADGLAEVVEAAQALHRSLRRLLSLPEHVEVWPGHIGGSLCGGGRLSDCLSSTIGYERSANEELFLDDEQTFVQDVILRTPRRPPTVETVVAHNRAPLADRLRLARLGPYEASALLSEGALLVDGRDAESFDRASIPGSICLPVGEAAVGTRAAWLARPEQDVLVSGADYDSAHALADKLVAVGLPVRGVLAGGVDAWLDAELPTSTIQAVDAETLARLIKEDAVTLVDVRDDDERLAFHVPGSLHLPWREIPARGQEAFAKRRPIAVACATGKRAVLAAGALRRASGPPVLRLAGAGIANLADHGVTLLGTPPRAHRQKTWAVR